MPLTPSERARRRVELERQQDFGLRGAGVGASRGVVQARFPGGATNTIDTVTGQRRFENPLPGQTRSGDPVGARMQNPMIRPGSASPVSTAPIPGPAQPQAQVPQINPVTMPEQGYNPAAAMRDTQRAFAGQRPRVIGDAINRANELAQVVLAEKAGLSQPAQFTTAAEFFDSPSPTDNFASFQAAMEKTPQGKAIAEEIMDDFRTWQRNFSKSRGMRGLSPFASEDDYVDTAKNTDGYKESIRGLVKDYLRDPSVQPESIAKSEAQRREAAEMARKVEDANLQEFMRANGITDQEQARQAFADPAVRNAFMQDTNTTKYRLNPFTNQPEPVPQDQAAVSRMTRQQELAEIDEQNQIIRDFVDANPGQFQAIPSNADPRKLTWQQVKQEKTPEQKAQDQIVVQQAMAEFNAAKQNQDFAKQRDFADVMAMRQPDEWYALVDDETQTIRPVQKHEVPAAYIELDPNRKTQDAKIITLPRYVDAMGITPIEAADMDQLDQLYRMEEILTGEELLAIADREDELKQQMTGVQ